MSDFGTMTVRIADELIRPDLAPHIQKAIQSAIRFYESERFWFNQGEATASTVADQEAIAVPTDFLEADVMTLTDGTVRFPLLRRSYDWIRSRSITTNVSARPQNWAYYADQIYLYPIPDAVYTLTLSYVKRLAALSAAGDTNDWMTHGEELIRERAKYDLLKGRGQDYQGAAALKVCVEEAFRNLRAKSVDKLGVKRLSIDPSLTRSAGYGYNINYD